MSTFIFANNAGSTLGSNLALGATVLTVATGTGSVFPAPSAGQQFSVTLTDAATGTLTEIVYCTARTGDSLTIVRAQEGTTARAWVVGDLVSNYWTAGQAAALVQVGVVQSQAGNFGTDTSGTNTVVADLTPAPASYAAITGAPIRLLKHTPANTGAVTINLNSLGAIALKWPGGAAIASGTLPAGSIFECFYNGTNFEMSSGLDVQSFESRTGNITLTGADVEAALGYIAANTAGDTFTGPIDVQTVAGGNYAVRIRAIASGVGILQFVDSTATTQWAAIISPGNGLPLKMSGASLVRVAVGTTANSGQITTGTGAAPTLDVGEIYLQTA